MCWPGRQPKEYKNLKRMQFVCETLILIYALRGVRRDETHGWVFWERAYLFLFVFLMYSGACGTVRDTLPRKIRNFLIPGEAGQKISSFWVRLVRKFLVSG